MNIGIYDPYFHILGGAERYVLTIADCLQNGAEITFYAQKEDLEKVPQKFGMDVSYINTCPWFSNSAERDQKLKQHDLFFYVTDGSLFRSTAKKNVLLIQTPVHIPSRTLLNSLKLFSWQKLICYSDFMAAIIYKKLGKTAQTLFVPVSDIVKEKPDKKNMIISVGRFFPNLHNKKQKEMVELFQQLIAAGVSDCELYLVGSVDPGGEAYLGAVEKASAGLTVKILTSVTYNELGKLYSRAKVYWHAAGFGEDLLRFPEKAEHFGVVTLEAMAHQTVPVVFAAGGQLELVTNGYNGFTWQTPAELIKYTKELLVNDPLRNRISENAVTTARKYTKDHFCDILHEILES